jgi:hypothetical protein
VNRLKFLHEDTEYFIDVGGSFTVGESVALEEDWNLTVEQLEAGLRQARPPLRTLMALLWVAKVRTIAAADGTTFLPAAAKYPAAGFEVGLDALAVEEDATENPTPPGGKTLPPGTPTTRRTSGAKRPRAA